MARTLAHEVSRTSAPAKVGAQDNAAAATCCNKQCKALKHCAALLVPTVSLV